MLTSVREIYINAKPTHPVIIQKDHTIAPVTVDLVGTDLTVQVKFMTLANLFITFKHLDNVQL